MKYSQIKLANDYSTPFPLWAYDSGGEGPYFDRSIVSSQLGEELSVWANVFDNYYDDMSGWPSLEICHTQYQHGLNLFEKLKSTLGPGIDVTYDFWELVVMDEIIDLNTLTSKNLLD